VKTSRALVIALLAGCSPLGERTLPDFLEQPDAASTPDATSAPDATGTPDASPVLDAAPVPDEPAPDEPAPDAAALDANVGFDAAADARVEIQDAQTPAPDVAPAPDAAPDAAPAVDATAAFPEAGPLDGALPPPARDAQPEDMCLNSCLPCGGDLALDQDGDGVRACEGDCDDLDPTRSLGRIELCNGIDDDCDGAIDEPYVELGQPCRVGRGACARAATFVCNLGTTEIECGAAAGLPADEACNEVDDDCDDRVDEGVRNACGACGPSRVRSATGRTTTATARWTTACGTRAARADRCPWRRAMGRTTTATAKSTTAY